MIAWAFDRGCVQGLHCTVCTAQCSAQCTVTALHCAALHGTALRCRSRSRVVNNGPGGQTLVWKMEMKGEAVYIWAYSPGFVTTALLPLVGGPF